MRVNYKLAIIISLGFLTLPPLLALAADVSALQAQINDRNNQIKKLETEIAAYQTQLTKTSQQSNTLKGEVSTLNTTLKNLGAQTRLTSTKITKTNLTLDQIGNEISDKESTLERERLALGETMRRLSASERQSTIEMLLTTNSLADFWRERQRLASFSGSLNDEVAALRDLKQGLEDKQAEQASNRDALTKLKSQLVDQQKITDQNRATKATLLAQTKNQDAAYQKLLADKQAQKTAFEKELFDFESQLKIAIDPNSLPNAGQSLFAWPLDDIHITQFFGRTVDAARLYVSGTHNGVDFRATLGTPVKSIGEGTITATGNTDLQTGCYSYGQWVLVDQHNGLSSLYGHLSLIKAQAGQSVGRGEIIGYSGKTGYATGPHLHLTIYATQGLEVSKYTNSLHCQNVVIPIAATKAYLDPMLYLPSL